MAASISIRRGKSKNLTLELDAVELLPLLSPSRKGQGRLLSELIRQEVTTRERRAAYLATGKPPWGEDEASD